MKKIFVSLLGLIALAVPTMASAETGTAVSSIFLRESPNKDGRIVGAFQKGDSLQFTSAEGSPNWIQVKAKGKTGYVVRSAVLASANAPSVVTVAPKSGTVARVGLVESKEAEKAPSASRVFEIVAEPSAEEVQLLAKNLKLEGQISVLEAQVKALRTFETGAAKLRGELNARQKQFDALHAMFPYIQMIETLDTKGKEVFLSGLGNAKMIEAGDTIIIRLEGTDIAKGDKSMRSVTKERYQTGSGAAARAYYVLNAQSIKTIN